MHRPHWLSGKTTLPTLMVGSLLLGACSVSVPWGTKTATTLQTATVQRGTVETTINATGTAKAVGDVTLNLGQGGAITDVLVKVGDRVTAGQPLVKANTRNLELALQQAEASLASAQAQYEQTKAGATTKELEQAQAAVDQAQAKAHQTAVGTTTAQDIANAEAALRSAQAKLDATVAGTTTAQDIANAEAALRSAQAKLDATVAGTTTQDIANAEAALRSAQAKLDQVEAGATAAELASAVQSLTQAQTNRQQQESQLSLNKEQARISMEQAGNDLRAAQEKYGAAKLIWDEAERTGKDPTIAQQSNPVNKSYRDLTDAKRRQFKADYEAAELSMKNAEQALEQKQIAYEEAKKQEIVGLQGADAQITSAQANLDDLRAGPKATDVTQAQAAVDQARANLDKLNAPAKDTDVAQAQASVDQAQSNLDKLKAPAKTTDVAQAQAAVDQARASLEKLKRPADADDVTQAQASVASAQATLTELQAGPTTSDLATALASLKQAEASRDLAHANLTDATLTAPFAGSVAAVNAMVGQQSSTSSTTGLVTLVDDSTLSIDVNIAETDIAKVQPNQVANATFTALPNTTVPGHVSAISPKATVTSNVVSYVATVALDSEAKTVVKAGMTATVSIVTASKSDVLSVPNKVVQTQNQQKVVPVLFKGEQFTTPVQVGLVGDSTTEIVSGLAQGDVIVTSTTSTTTSTGTTGTTGTGTQVRTGVGGGGFAVPGAGGPPR